MRRPSRLQNGQDLQASGVFSNRFSRFFNRLGFDDRRGRGGGFDRLRGNLWFSGCRTGEQTVDLVAQCCIKDQSQGKGERQPEASKKNPS